MPLEFGHVRREAPSREAAIEARSRRLTDAHDGWGENLGAPKRWFRLEGSRAGFEPLLPLIGLASGSGCTSRLESGADHPLEIVNPVARRDSRPTDHGPTIMRPWSSFPKCRHGSCFIVSGIDPSSAVFGPETSLESLNGAKVKKQITRVSRKRR